MIIGDDIGSGDDNMRLSEAVLAQDLYRNKASLVPNEFNEV